MHFSWSHDITKIMAMRRHNNSMFLGLLALILVFPPLTSVVAAGLGLDLSHHHCGSEVHDSVVSHHDSDHDVHRHAEHVPGPDLEQHGSSDSEPYQCDQCHVVLAAMAYDVAVAVMATSPLPSPDSAAMLFAVRPPPAFKPPIA